MRSWSLARFSCAAALAFLGPVSCTDDECLPGTEGCTCLAPDPTCATGLVCRQDLCVPMIEDAGTTSSGPSSASTDPATTAAGSSAGSDSSADPGSSTTGGSSTTPQTESTGASSSP